MLFSNRSCDPAREIEHLRDQMSGLFSGVRGAVHEYPPVNIYANDNDAVITSEVPGIDPQAIEISVKGNVLTLRGKREPANGNADDKHLRRERIFSEFSREIMLPFQVDAAKVSASFKHGVLRIELPRAEADKPRKIKVIAA